MNKGLSLIEIMLSLAIFGILIVFASKMLNVSEVVSDNNNEDVAMTEVAESIGEILRVTPAALTIDGSEDTISYPFPTGTAIYYYTVNNSPAETDSLTKSSIRVSKTEKGLEKESDSIEIEIYHP